ncbi:MAG: hypothetical protein OES20_02350 [Gammaproteobacteria bacterium]|nr:hypothetical protein [Gammaproteobacteria bacterium]MDH3857405.1 hypothetical protein [Gammaproteobacteria bacterium]
MAELSNKPLRFLLQAINYSVFMALIWYFASAPSVRIIENDEAMITIAFAHAGELREPCRMLSQEELNQLAPNMRKIDDCPRERSPVTIEAMLDGEPFYSASLQPPGLFEDGGVDVFHSAKIRAGTHRLHLQMNDSVRIEGFNHRFEREVSIDPAQILLVGFESGQGFVIRGAQK